MTVRPHKKIKEAKQELQNTKYASDYKDQALQDCHYKKSVSSSPCFFKINTKILIFIFRAYIP